MKKVVEKANVLTDDFDNDLYYNLEEFQKEENYELGMNQGKKDKSIEIAKNLLRKNLPDKDIIEVTNITIEELKEIKNENNHD